MPKETDIESITREKGSAIFSAIEGQVPSFFDTKRMKGKLMDWTMKDENFKIQLFRFIDALPALKSDAEVSRLLKEYFSGEETLLPKAIEKWLPGGRLFGAIAGKVIKKNVVSLARQFIAGRTPEEALGPVDALWRDGRAFSIDLLGETVLSDNEAYLFIERYLNLIETMSGAAGSWPENDILEKDNRGNIPRIDISLKISSFYARLDPIDQRGAIDELRKALRQILELAADKEVSITFDMEHYHLKDTTIAVFKEVIGGFPGYEFAGIAIQTYLKETEKDLTELIDWARKRKRIIAIRLVKGAYWDYEKVVNRQMGWPVPVFESKAETDMHFEAMTRLLLDNADVVRPAIASHNIRSIAHAMAYAESLQLPRSSFEFQALYGMAEPIKKAVADMGYRVREYVPVGEFLPGMAYFVRRLLENTSNESFLRLNFVEKKNFDSLMAKPELSHTERPGEKFEKEREHIFENEPLLDFSREENRKNFAAAVYETKQSMGKEKKIPARIAGNQVLTGDEIDSINPASPSDVVGRVSSVSAEDVEKAVRYASEHRHQWASTPVEKRAKYLFGAAAWMKERRFDLAALQVFEVGKSWAEADADVTEAIDFLNFYGREMIRLGHPARLGSLPGELNHLHHLPKGVAVVISPWNFPLAITCGMTAAALVSGNMTILKPSSLSPVTAGRLMEAFEAAGLPGGVLQFLPGSGSRIGNALVEHKDVDVIAFTGSMEVGLGIVEKAGKTVKGQRSVKKVIAEMGGKNAIIVDSSADLDVAIKGVLGSFIGFQGQKCSACSRVIVMRDIYDEFLDRLTRAAESVTIGLPEEPSNMMGPVIDETAFKKIKGFIDIGKQEAKLHHEGYSPSEGYFIGPVIFRDVDPKCRIATEEIFGPVLSVIRASSFDEAIRIANGTDYALTGGIFSRSPVNIRRAVDEFVAGNFYINRKITGALVGRQPFGGFGMSGLGSKAGGEEYLLHFMNPKCVTENTLRRGFAPEE